MCMGWDLSVLPQYHVSFFLRVNEEMDIHYLGDSSWIKHDLPT